MNLSNKIVTVIILVLIHSCTTIYCQDWKKSLKKATKKATKEVKKKIKPLEIDFTVTDVDYNPLKSLNKLKITILFDGKNPNPVGVAFNKTEFDLFVNDKHVSKFYNDKKIKIPKNGKFSFEEKAELKLVQSGKTIFDAIAKNKAVYKITGKYYVKTSLGTFSFKAKLMEKVVN